MLEKLVSKFKNLGAYKKRGVIYISVAVLFLGYELIAHNPPRVTVILLWLGVVIIAISVMVSIKEPEN